MNWSHAFSPDNEVVIPRTRWDKAWFVITEVVTHVAEILTFALVLLLGINMPGLLKELWAGTPAATIGVIMALLFVGAVLKLLRWGVRETTEWIFCTIEELCSHPKVGEDRKP